MWVSKHHHDLDMNHSDPKHLTKYIDRMHAAVGVGCIGFGIQQWVNSNVSSALAVIPLGVTFLILVPIRQRGGDVSSHWIWLATGVVIVGLLWTQRSGWFG